MQKEGHALGYQHKLKLTTNTPVIKKNYPIPFAVRKDVEEAIDEMVRANIIERAISPHCNPIRIVKKGDGKIRVCLDARQINNVIEDDQESPPLIPELMQDFIGTKIYSKFDLMHGYWQLELHEDSRPLTAFLFNGTQYQYKRVPFGIKTAGAGFIRALKKALIHIIQKKKLKLYIDDGGIGTETFEEQIEILEMIFERLIEYNFTLKFSKCVFFKSEIQFLGFTIMSTGIKPNMEKLKCIQDFEEPKNKTELQSFLGVCNYYR